MKKLLLLLLLVPVFSFGQTADDLNNRGNAKQDNKDYYGAINDYSKAIELNPDIAYYYDNRGNAKNYLKDYYGAINDYSKAIELNPDYAYYSNRGIAKYNLNDIDGACKDLRKAISKGSTSNIEWINKNCY